MHTTTQVLRLAVLVLSLVPLLAVQTQNTNSPCVVADEDLDATIPPEERERQALDGRLGGQFASWDALYGEGEGERTSGTDDLAYAFEDCGPLTGVQFVYERAVLISLYADRPEDIEDGTLSDPDEADWTQDEAQAIAWKVLPKDTELAEPEETDAGNLLIEGESEILGAYTAQDRYDVVNATGDVGALDVILYLDEVEEVYAIDVQLGGYGGTGNETSSSTEVVDTIFVEPTETPPPTEDERQGLTSGNCDPSYPDACIPPAPPDLDCGDVSDRRFSVVPPDPHNFDSDFDGIGCESD